MSIEPVKQFETLYDLLKDRKYVTIENGNLRYSEDFNDPNVKWWASSNVKYTDIEYIYMNPQFNRMFAHLVDGRDIDYDLSFRDIVWNTFLEYIPPKPPKRKMTIDEINKELGYEIEIIL